MYLDFGMSNLEAQYLRSQDSHSLTHRQCKVFESECQTKGPRLTDKYLVLEWSGVVVVEEGLAGRQCAPNCALILADFTPIEQKQDV